MSNSFEDASNEQLVNGAVENALNEFTNDVLNFPVNFPTDAPETNHMEGQPQSQEHEQQQQQQQQQQQHQYEPNPFEIPVEAQQQQHHYLSDQMHQHGLTGKVVVEPYPKNKSKQSKKKKHKSDHNTGRWTEAEHYQFLQGVAQHGKNCTKIASLIPSRTTLQVRTHAQKYFQKLESKQAAATAALGVGIGAIAPPRGNEITSPVAAQTLLGMSQLTSQPQRPGSKRKLDLGGSKSSKSKPSNRCQYRDCKSKCYRLTKACLRHQIQLCTYPNCGDFVEEDVRFSQKRELCKVHYNMLTSRSRSMYEKRSERP
eukprot:CCRYP_015713-RA/>CCRYP_015713-RA protein AED:0.38 eAED:0.38 QI:0/-1/0/1/-1/1/1/0/312